MSFTLGTVAILVFLFWIVILGIYVVVARRQGQVAHQIEDLENQLDDSKKE